MSCAAGVIRLRTPEDGGVEIDYDAQAVEVLLDVSQAIELRDGDLVCAGRQWLSFEAGQDGRAPRLHLLDPMGDVHMTMTIRDSSWTLGREAGDVTFPWDDQLGELHLQILVRGDTVFVQSLAADRGTWVLVRPGEVVPSGCRLAVGDRVLRVCSAGTGTAPGIGPITTPLSADEARLAFDPADCTRVFVAA